MSDTPTNGVELNFPTPERTTGTNHYNFAWYRRKLSRDSAFESAGRDTPVL